MDYVMRRRSTVGGALEMFSLPLPLQWFLVNGEDYEIVTKMTAATVSDKVLQHISALI